MKIAFIGTGIMGKRMAGRLLEEHDVTVFNRTTDKTAPLVRQGARAAASAGDAVGDADIVFSMLSEPPVVREVALGPEGFLGAMKKGSLWVDISTGNPAFSREMAATARQGNIRFMDAPVAGSRPQAEKGELVFLVGGEQQDLDSCAPCLERMGNKILHIGGHGQGMAMKMVINHLLGTAMQSFAEGMTLGESLGINRTHLLDIMLSSPVSAPFIKMKRDKLETGDFLTDFSLKWMHKDMAMVAETAYQQGVAMPLGAASGQSYRQALLQGLSEKDFAAIYEFLAATKSQ